MLRLPLALLIALAFTLEAAAQQEAAPAATDPSETRAAVENKPDKERVKLILHELAEGELTFKAPEDWKPVKRRNNIIEMEFAVPGETEEETPGRLTMMASGGSIEANLARWIGQFKGTGAGTNRERAKIEKEKVAGMPLTILDISGTFMDSMRGPFGPKVEKPDHRMIAGILQTGSVGNYFFKFVGPASLVEANSEAFRDLLKSATKQNPAQQDAKKP